MAEISTDREWLEINYITKLLDGEGKTIKSKVKGKTVINIHDIRAVDYFYTDTGVLDKTKCRIFHQDLGWMSLVDPYDEIKNYKFKIEVPITGFQRKKERIKTLKNYGK